MTVFNRANRLKVIKKENCYPFGQQEFSIPGTQNVKKVFSEETINKIYYYDDSKLLPRWRKPVRKARSFWFFMYFGQGMNPKDVALLKFKNIHGEHIIFERAKTEDTMGDDTPQICVFNTSDMLTTINEFGNSDQSPDNFIFPIFDPAMTALRQMEVLEYFIKFVNKWIQYLLDELGIDETAGCQVARGSYATCMAEAGSSLLEIGRDLGHKKPSTTARYVGSLPLSKKKVNASRLEAFKRPPL
jgi:integrase